MKKKFIANLLVMSLILAPAVTKNSSFAVESSNSKAITVKVEEKPQTTGNSNCIINDSSECSHSSKWVCFRNVQSCQCEIMAFINLFAAAFTKILDSCNVKLYGLDISPLTPIFLVNCGINAVMSYIWNPNK